MALGYTDFLSEFAQRSISYNNNWSIKITLPESLFGYSSRTLELTCTETTLPGRNIQTGERITAVHPRTFGYGSIYSDITLNFILTGDLEVKKFFEDWQSTIHNEINGDVGYYDDYVAELQIFVHDPITTGAANLSDTDLVIISSDSKYVSYAASLIECWPITIADMNLTSDDAAPNYLSVTFKYRYYIDASKREDYAKLSEGGVLPNKDFIAPAPTNSNLDAIGSLIASNLAQQNLGSDRVS